jgi:hypothetical protein
MSNDTVIEIYTSERSENGIKESSEPLSSHRKQLICSSNLKYVATWNEKDKMISIWQISSPVNVVNSLTKIKDIKLNEIIEKLLSLPKIKFNFGELVDISDEKLLVLELESDGDPYRG